MKYYIRHLGDYARDAGYLSIVEHGAYNLLLDWSYANERPIPREIAYDICKAVTRTEKQAVLRVLERFFQWDIDSGWRHKRVEQEIARMNEKAEKARRNINSRWEKQKQKDDTDVLPTYNARNTDELQLHNPITPILQNGSAATPIRRGKGLRLIGDILKTENGDGR